MRYWIRLAALAGLVMAGACSRSVAAPVDPDPAGDEAAATTGVFGAEFEVDGVVVVPKSVGPFEKSSLGVPRIRLVISSDNQSEMDQNNPDVRLVCAESNLPADWFWGSTWEPNASLGSGVQRQGEVILGFPPKVSDPQYTVADCAEPRIRVAFDPLSNDDPIRYFPVPQDVIQAAVEATPGPPLPLPQEGG